MSEDNHLATLERLTFQGVGKVKGPFVLTGISTRRTVVVAQQFRAYGTSCYVSGSELGVLSWPITWNSNETGAAGVTTAPCGEFASWGTAGTLLLLLYVRRSECLGSCCSPPGPKPRC